MPKPVASDPPGPLARYRAKRDFDVTAEPRGESSASSGGLADLSFVVQKHAASRLHYDFRLELGGVLMSWAVPKGPSLDPADKRLAIHVEDHPLSYGSFEGTIPPGQYGAGTVIVWDQGTWEPVGDPRDGLAKGKLLFKLHGQKLGGLWELVKIAKPGDKPNKQEAWILFKKRGDAFARPGADYDVVTALPDSVIAKPCMCQSSGNKPVPGAIKARLPDKLRPQLATLVTEVPASGDWLYEIKFDGYRLMTRIDQGKASLITRGGHDWSDKLPELVADIESLGVESAWLDGEIVVLDESGMPSFSRLQKAFEPAFEPAFKLSFKASFKQTPGAAGIDYFLFDLPYFEGYDLRELPLIERRRLLKALLDEKGRNHEHLRFSADFSADPASVLESACRMKLEGVIAKRSDAPYASRRTPTWLKLKCKLRQEFVIAGYTDRSDGSPQIGSLLLGVYANHSDRSDKGGLVSVGSVGTGWDAAEASELKLKLAKLEVPNTPFSAGADKPGRWSKRVGGTEHWVKPLLVAEVEYAAMTPDGQLRHASYLALRADKAPKSIHREIAKTAGKTSMNALKVTHSDRVIDASTGLTKLDLVRYYEAVADFILPHLKGRPCSLLRGPTGVDGPLFFQKHSERTAIPGVENMDVALWPGHDALLEVATPAALAAAAQMNVIEFHTWNSTAKHITKPDRMIFDLDPGQGTPWEQIQEAAMLVRGFLQELKLESWLKTSGGKGLHVVVPLAPRLACDTVNQFSKAVVEHLARVIPARFVAKSGPANRIGKLFVDYLRNGQGATTVAAFSARARPGLGVSMPIQWDELPQLKSSAQWTISTARDYLSFQAIDPWADYWKSKQTLTAGMKLLGFQAATRKA